VFHAVEIGQELLQCILAGSKMKESANAKTQVLLRANKRQRKMAKLPKCT